MRLQRIRVGAFGPLEDWSSGEEPLPELVVVLGPNESGKSSLFRAVGSLLHGIYPTSRDSHRWAPWSGRDMEIAAEVCLASGEVAEVRRRLLSSPRGEITLGETVEPIGNHTLPWARHVPRDLFQEVYALTLADLAALERDTWQQVQERLLGAMGAGDLRSIRAVVKELQGEADGLWRSDNRAKPRSKRLARRRKELLGARREARDRERELRDRLDERDRLDADLKEKREEEIRLKTRIRRMETLGPVRDGLRRIAGEEERRGDPGELEGLPGDPPDTLERLEAAAEGARGRAEKRKEQLLELKGRAERLGEGGEPILEIEDRIRELLVEAGEMAFHLEHLERLRARLEARERDCRARAGELLTVPWEEMDPRALEDFTPGDLNVRIRALGEATRDAERLQDRLDALAGDTPPSGPPPLPVLGVVLLAGGALLALWGLLVSTPPPPLTPGLLLGLGGAAAVGGLVLAAVWWQARRHREAAHRRHRARAEELGKALEEARTAQEARLREVKEMVAPLPVVQGRLEAGGPELHQELVGLQRADREARSTAREVRELEERTGRFGEALEEVGEELGLALPPRIPGAQAVLEKALEEAKAREAEREKVREDLERARRELHEAQAELGDAEKELTELRDRLAAMGDGDPRAGAEAARERLEAAGRARDFRSELERAHPDLEELWAEIREAEEAGEAWTRDGEALVRARETLDRLVEEEKELTRRKAELDARVERLEGGESLDRVDGALERLEEEAREVRRRRDRLAVLAELLRVADHRFRDENQPDLLRRASDHLSRITRGRYDRILVQEGDMDGTLLLRGPGLEAARPVDTPISTGTREQVYLALRLAIVDHLDGGAETLPLFVDEALVNWDRGRRDRGLDLFRELSGERQIFVFTCHEETAEALESRGGRILRLAEPR